MRTTQKNFLNTLSFGLDIIKNKIKFNLNFKRIVKMKKKLALLSLVCLSACATAQEKANVQNCQLVENVYNQNANATFSTIFDEYKAKSGLANGAPEVFMSDIKKSCAQYVNLNTILNLEAKYKAQYAKPDRIKIPAKIGGKPIAESSLGVFAIDELRSTHPKPKKGVIYNYDSVGLGYKLKVFQNAKDGIIVEARNEFGHGEALLHLKTKQKYADGDDLDSGNYAYEGLFQYNSVLGIKRTIYSFKEVN